MIEKKLEVLVNHGVIAEQTRLFVLKVFRVLSDKGIALENQETFLIHLAMAESRALKGELVEPMDASLKEELLTDSDFKVAKTLWQQLASLSNGVGSVQFKEEELDYFYLNLLTLLKD